MQSIDNENNSARSIKRLRRSLSNVNVKKPSMVVWDFDLTLTKDHTWHVGFRTKEDVMKLSNQYVRDNVFADFEFFKEALSVLKEHSIPIGIATFQYADVVKALLDKAFDGEENNPFGYENIMDRLFIFRNKWKMLLHLASQNDIDISNLGDGEDGGKGGNGGCIWFFDDDVSNLLDIEKKSKKKKVNIKTFLVDRSVHFVRDAYKKTFKEPFVEVTVVI